MYINQNRKTVKETLKNELGKGGNIRKDDYGKEQTKHNVRRMQRCDARSGRSL